MTYHYPDLGSASDWSCHVGNVHFGSPSRVNSVTARQSEHAPVISDLAGRLTLTGTNFWVCGHDFINKFLPVSALKWFFLIKGTIPVKNFDLLLIRSKTCTFCRSKTCMFQRVLRKRKAGPCKFLSVQKLVRTSVNGVANLNAKHSS